MKLWYIPDGGLSTHLSDWLIDLRGHKRRVGHLEWHPTAENILVSAGFDHLVIHFYNIFSFIFFINFFHISAQKKFQGV